MNHNDNLNLLYLSVGQTAERYGASTDSIWRWERAGDFRKPVRSGGSCARWRLADVLEHESTFKACFSERLGLWDAT